MELGPRLRSQPEKIFYRLHYFYYSKIILKFAVNPETLTNSRVYKLTHNLILEKSISSWILEQDFLARLRIGTKITDKSVAKLSICNFLNFNLSFLPLKLSKIFHLQLSLFHHQFRVVNLDNTCFYVFLKFLQPGYSPFHPGDFPVKLGYFLIAIFSSFLKFLYPFCHFTFFFLQCFSLSNFSHLAKGELSCNT